MDHEGQENGEEDGMNDADANIDEALIVVCLFSLNHSEVVDVELISWVRSQTHRMQGRNNGRGKLPNRMKHE